jgi:hypothetical protein
MTCNYIIYHHKRRERDARRVHLHSPGFNKIKIEFKNVGYRLLLSLSEFLVACITL